MPQDNEKLLFIDTNIWLNFYRGRGSDLSLKLLHRVKSISDRLIGALKESSYNENSIV